MTESKPIVYVVDDETDALEVFEDALSLEFTITTFSRPEEAVHAILKNPPDALVTDLVMPNMDGVEFVKNIRKTNTELPIVVMSGYGEKDQIVNLFRMGCLDFLTKPFKYQELAEKIKQVLEHQKEVRSGVDQNQASELVKIEETNSGLKVFFAKDSLNLKENAQLIRLQLLKAQSAITSAITFDFSEVEDVCTDNVVFLKSYFDNLEQDGRRFHWHDISSELDILLSSQLLTYNSAM